MKIGDLLPTDRERKFNTSSQDFVQSIELAINAMYKTEDQIVDDLEGMENIKLDDLEGVIEQGQQFLRWIDMKGVENFDN